MSHPLKKYRMALIFLLVTILGVPPFSAHAAQKVHVSFVLYDVTANKNAGSGSTIVLRQVNRNDNQQHQTSSDGTASFDIDPVDYILNSFCNSCQGDFVSHEGTQYLISPQSDGSVKVLSAADKAVVKDKDGNFIVEANVKREVVGNDPWQLLKNQPNFGGGPEHLYLMTNGKVLMQSRDGQGFDKWWLLTPSNTGSYIDGTWSQVPTPSGGYNPKNMNGAVLHSGNFMIVGGEQNTNASGVMEDNTNQSYIYDVVKNSWANVPPPMNGMGDWKTIGAAPFIELADGRVMVGRNGSTNSAGIPAMLYDETKGSWTLTGTNKNTSNNEEGYTLLANDKVLNVWNGDDNPQMLGMAETFDPSTGLWTLTSKAPVSTGHGEIGPAISLPNGKVLQMGATGKNELFDPANNTWTLVPDFPKLKNGLQLAAADNESVVLPSGNVLVITSVFTCSTENCYWMGPARWFEYDIASNSWSSVNDDPIISSASNIANGVQVLSLPNGQVMMSGEGRIAFYTSKSTNLSWSPVVSTVSSSELSPNNTYSISGNQLSGLTQGTAWGDEQQNQTNYGIVQITNKVTGHVSFARSFDYSSTSIQPDVPSTLKFVLDPKTENGPSLLRVIASGFASAPTNVTISGGVDVKAPPVQIPISTTKKSANATITCVKGKNIKKVSGTTPKCPSGYMKK
jgi:hypothetical protein